MYVTVGVVFFLLIFENTLKIKRTQAIYWDVENLSSYLKAILKQFFFFSYWKQSFLNQIFSILVKNFWGFWPKNWDNCLSQASFDQAIKAVPQWPKQMARSGLHVIHFSSPVISLIRNASILFRFNNDSPTEIRSIKIFFNVDSFVTQTSSSFCIQPFKNDLKLFGGRWSVL